MSRFNVCRACNFYGSGGKSRIAIPHTCNEFGDIGDFDLEEENKYFDEYLKASKKTRLSLIKVGLKINSNKLVDCLGNEINEGDTLTFDWFDGEDSEHLILSFPKVEDREEYKHLPVFKVERKESGRLCGRGIDKKLYLHDFRFEYTKKIINEI